MLTYKFSISSKISSQIWLLLMIPSPPKSLWFSHVSIPIHSSILVLLFYYDSQLLHFDLTYNQNLHRTLVKFSMAEWSICIGGSKLTISSALYSLKLLPCPPPIPSVKLGYANCSE